MKLSLKDIPKAPADWEERINHRIRNDPTFRVNGVESLAKLLDDDMNNKKDVVVSDEPQYR